MLRAHSREDERESVMFRADVRVIVPPKVRGDPASPCRVSGRELASPVTSGGSLCLAERPRGGFRDYALDVNPQSSLFLMSLSVLSL